MGHQVSRKIKLLAAHFQFVPQKSSMVAHLRLALKLTRAPRCDSTSCSPAQFQCQPKICHYTTFFKYGHQTVFFVVAWTGVSKAQGRLQRLGTKPWNKKVSPCIYIQYTLQELYEVLDLRNQREINVCNRIQECSLKRFGRYGTKPNYPFFSWIFQLVKWFRIQNLRSVILIFIFKTQCGFSRQT